jgi:AraC-like DNA-binding protein
LEAALPTANSELARACDRIIHEYLARLESGTTSQLIRNRLLNTLSKCEISEEVIAHSLHMSLRTLQRTLKEDGLTFKGLVDDLRHELAIQYIRDSRLAIGESAYLLGFSGPSNFTRAFRRWTGMSPNFFRVAAKA